MSAPKDSPHPSSHFPQKNSVVRTELFTVRSHHCHSPVPPQKGPSSAALPSGFVAPRLPHVAGAIAAGHLGRTEGPASVDAVRCESFHRGYRAEAVRRLALGYRAEARKEETERGFFGVGTGSKRPAPKKGTSKRTGMRADRIHHFSSIPVLSNWSPDDQIATARVKDHREILDGRPVTDGRRGFGWSRVPGVGTAVPLSLPSHEGVGTSFCVVYL